MDYSMISIRCYYLVYEKCAKTAKTNEKSMFWWANAVQCQVETSNSWLSVGFMPILLSSNFGSASLGRFFTARIWIPNYIITGDANLCSIKWREPGFLRKNIANQLVNTLKLEGIDYAQTKPTFQADHLNLSGEL